MKIFAISDLHLPGNSEKPMDIFGDHWTDHWQQISYSWKENITKDDVTLIAGDISWAMDFNDVIDDLKKISDLPGKKILIKGNHDYWWQSITKVRQALPEGMYALQNDALRFDDFVICGTRGWICPGSNQYNATNHEKIYNREGQRLTLTLNDAKRKSDKSSKLIVMMHYPPFNDKLESNIFTDQIEEIKPETVIYGHLHGIGAHSAFEGNLRGVNYKMTACDFINFEPVRVL